MKRPLVWIALLYASGVLAGEYVPLPLIPLFATTFALVVVAIIWARARHCLLYPLLVMVGLLSLTLSKSVLYRDDLRNLLPSEPALATLRGKLHETPAIRSYDDGRNLTWRSTVQIDVSEARLHNGPWQSAHGRIVASTTGQLIDFFAGQIVEIEGVAAPPKPAIAEGLFDYRGYLARVGIYYHLNVTSEKDWKLIQSPRRPPMADRFREWARKALAMGLPEEDEALRLEYALTLGWRPALTEEVAEPFIRAATYHIFAVDGLRMAIIFGIFFQLFRFCRVPRPAIGLMLLPLIWGYVALTGWPASAIRATVMLTIVILSWVLRRPMDLLNSLFGAAIIILVWEPQQLFQSGFQLSFCVVLCIILLMPVLEKITERIFAPDPFLPPELRTRWHPVIVVPMKFVWETLLVSFAAWIGSLPLTAYYFNIVSPVSTPANLLAVPLCMLVLISNLSSLLLAGWFPAAAIIFNHAGWWLMTLISVSSEWFARWPRAYAYVPAPGLFTSLLFYAIFLAAVTGWIFRKQFRIYKLTALTVALTVWTALWLESRGTSRITILPLNDSSAVFVDAPGSSNDLLLNCGTAFASQLTLKPFLRAQGVNRLSNLGLTHGAAHTVGGAPLINTLFAPEKIWTSPLPTRSSPYRRFLDELNRSPEKHSIAARGLTACSWTVLHPDETDRFTRADDGAMVLAGTIEKTRILLLSELGRAGQNSLLGRPPDLKADIVIAGMPSKGEPLSSQLLDAIQPKVIILTDSELPVNRRASQKLCDRLEQQKVPVLYLRKTGAISLELHQGDWELRTMSGQRLRGKELKNRASLPPTPIPQEAANSES
jgi:competence protein ComEC